MNWSYRDHHYNPFKISNQLVPNWLDFFICHVHDVGDI